jgi:hypothetical protein
MIPAGPRGSGFTRRRLLHAAAVSLTTIGQPGTATGYGAAAGWGGTSDLSGRGVAASPAMMLASDTATGMLPTARDLGRVQVLYQVDDIDYLGHSTVAIGEGYSRKAWDWTSSSGRWFVAGRASPSDANLVFVAVHRFGNLPNRDQALASFIDDRRLQDGYDERPPLAGYPNRPRLMRVDPMSTSVLMLDSTDIVVVEVAATGWTDPSFDAGGMLRRCMERAERGSYAPPQVAPDSTSGRLLFGPAGRRTWRGEDWIVCGRWCLGGMPTSREQEVDIVASLRIVNRTDDPMMFPFEEFPIVNAAGDLVMPLGSESRFFDLETEVTKNLDQDEMLPGRVYELGLRFRATNGSDTVEMRWLREDATFGLYMKNRD